MNNSVILIVDDEQNNRNSIIRLFEDYEIEFLQAENGAVALEVVEKNHVDLILLDIKMPVMDGFGFLEKYSQLTLKPDPPVCIMTAFNDTGTRRKSIYLGADDFINKPIDPVELETRIASLLRISKFQQDLTRFNETLEQKVDQRTKQLRLTLEQLKKSKRELSKAYREMIGRISKLTQFNQNVNSLNLYQLGLCTAALGWLIGLPEEDIDNLHLSTQLYNIGMLALPEKLREAPMETINKDEMRILSAYTKMGSDLFKDSNISLLQQTHNICKFCEEHFDGSGLPNGVSGESIPIEARLFSVAKLILETLKHFKENHLEYVRNSLREHSGNLLDPTIVTQLLEADDVLENLVQDLVES